MGNQDGDGDVQCPSGQHLAAVTMDVAGAPVGRRLARLGTGSGISPRLFCQLQEPPRNVI